MPRRDSSSDSDRGSYRRRRDRKRNSSSPDSRGNSESSIDKSKRKTYRSRSRSGSHSRSSRRRSRSRSLSARRSPRRYSRRSRSLSRGRTSRRSRSRSGSRKRRSRSGSRKPHRRSKSSSPKSKPSKTKTEKDNAEFLKLKVQQAIKAAANASAELREKGLLSEPPSSNASITIGDQLKRAQAIDDINSQSFVQQEFVSSRNVSKTVTPKNDDNFDKDGHMSAIFGLAAPKLGLNTNSADASIKKLESWKENPEMLVHESLFVDQSGKQERWLKKLFVLRRKKINEEM